MEENKTVAAEVTPAVEETKKTVLNASVAPENFDWDAFENDDVYGGSVEAIAEQYNQTLSKVPKQLTYTQKHLYYLLKHRQHPISVFQILFLHYFLPLFISLSIINIRYTFSLSKNN